MIDRSIIPFIVNDMETKIKIRAVMMDLIAIGKYRVSRNLY
jgi:hypothetical protein